MRDLDNSIWKAGGSTGCARLLTGLNCSVSEPMGVPLTPPWVVDLQCMAIVGLGPLAPIFVRAVGSTCTKRAGISTVIRPLVAPLLV